MNLFLLSWNVNECAEYHCDKHVVKMVLELTQMLYTSWHMNSGHVPRNAPVCRSTGEVGYRRISNPNHPMAKWVRAARWNYVFTARLACALCLEYAHRYENRTHGCAEHVLWLAQNIPSEFESLKKTGIPQCMPDQYKNAEEDPVLAYRMYYVEDKKRFAAWTNRPVPEFMK